MEYAGTLVAPAIDAYIRQMANRSICPDETSTALIDGIFMELKQLKPQGDDDRYELWLRAPRGTIDEFGDYEEMLEDGEIENREEFEKWWQAEYPEAVCWYTFCGIDRGDYRSIFLGHEQIIEQTPDQQGFPYDMSSLLHWLRDSLQETIEEIRRGVYNKEVAGKLPFRYRRGTISRKAFWRIFPELKTEYFAGMEQKEITEFVERMASQREQLEDTQRLPRMTAGMFYEYCSLGYRANQYPGREGLSAKKQYGRYADGRDDGLKDVPENSPEAFAAWLDDRKRLGGHPWEVCRGGNRTHISLYVVHDAHGYYLILDGSSYGRSMETVRFYLALARKGVPVYLNHGHEIAARITETDRIGIVPDGILPIYCEGMFPGENILDFMNLPFEKQEQVIASAKWYDEEPVELRRG